ncbi:MAG: hypothetical protein Crog4KO_19240 [Crocinitomicaceae bacterium]
MDKKIITSCLFAFLSLSLFGQEWKTIHIDDLGGSGFWLGASSDSKQFKIDKSSNTLWSSWFDEIYELRPDGSLVLHNNQSDNTLPAGSAAFLEFAFTNGLVYTVDLYSGGAFQFDGVSWQITGGAGNSLFVSAESDTVWICQSPGDIVQIISGIPTYHTVSARRIQSRNGNVWTSFMANGDAQSSLRYFEPGTLISYPANSHDYLLDNFQNDFKFMNNSDTFYVSGNKGFSIAIGSSFVDTLTPYNTTNMPYPEVVEFEFDHNDNIWALFGTDLDNVTHIGFLDRSTNAWTEVFDSNDSPIDYSDYMSLEIDSDGNVYVMQRDQLHVFGDNGGPQWLSVLVQTKQNGVYLYPNPSSGTINLSQFAQFNPSLLQIIDTQGKVLDSRPFNEIVDYNLAPGLYYLRVDDIGVYKIQVR